MPNFPTSYDSDPFGEPKELILLTLDGYHSNVTTTMAFNENISSLQTPGYITFLAEDVDGHFEIVRYTAKPTSYTLTVERGVLGSEAQEHQDNENAAHDPVSAHFSLLREILGAVQKYQGLVGTSLPGTCDEGEAYIKTSTSQFYRAIASNTWRLINNDDHGNYLGLSDNDHDLYHNETRKISWHNNERSNPPGGAHLTSPTTHDHSGGSYMGGPAAMIAGGPLSGLPGSPTSNRHVYFATDTADLYVGNNGSWVKYAVVPKGTMMVFETDCPAGWTRYASMDGKTPRGAPTGVWSGLTDGGNTTHDHEMKQVVNHSHSIAEQTNQATGGCGNHRHGVKHYSSGGSYTDPSWSKNTSWSDKAMSWTGDHVHTIDLPAHNTGSAGINPAKTETANSWAAYKKMVFCEKD